MWINHGDDDGQAPIESRVREAIEEALAGARTIVLHHRDTDGNESERRVDPQIFGNTHGHWYPIAHCHLRGAIRWFRLDRITATRLTKQPSTDRPISGPGAPPATAFAVNPG